jgi:general secretion pathway protein G
MSERIALRKDTFLFALPICLSLSPAPKRGKAHGNQSAAQAGFTLIEALVVLIIIALIMSLAAPRVLNYLASSKDKAAHLQIKALAGALDLYYLDLGRYPTTNEGLQGLVERPANAGDWSGPYLKDASVPNDPWGRPYVYRAPGLHQPYSIVSLGSSGQEGSPDNISSEQP